tara:strand:+ start:9746 stop:10153 length:408 start_codon:yes stop_codon:yes gene_type:complete
MSDIDSNITQALNAQVEVMLAALSYPAIWARKGGDTPAGAHVTIQHLRNDDVPLGLSDQVYTRQGFLVLTLVLPLNVYDVVSRRQAGDIAAYFKRVSQLTANGTQVTITAATIRDGREENQRWETPIYISYRSLS